MSESASQRRRAFRSAAPRSSLLAGLAGLLLVSLVLAVDARADNSAARPPASGAPKESALAPAKDTAPADPADLGRGLRFLQLAANTSDTAFAAALAAPALVLDLRLAPADPATESRLRELLAHVTDAHPLFVLLGQGTPDTLRAVIPAAAPGLLTIAAKDSGIAAGVMIAVEPARDRAATEALAAGKPPRELVEGRIEKARYDEARLAHDHANGHREREEAKAAPSPDPSSKQEKSATPAEPPLQDLLLQRAVFIHRGLLALGRIPEHT
jgi:hypothetical protein